MNQQQQTFYLTQEGFQRIQREHQALAELIRTKIQEEASQCLKYTDDPDPECLSYQEELEDYQKRRAMYETILKHAVIISAPRNPQERRIVGLGAKVLVRINRSTHVLKIVGPLEADPSEGKISNECPVGKALLGRRPGEQVVVPSPDRTVYQIEKIIY